MHDCYLDNKKTLDLTGFLSMTLFAPSFVRAPAERPVLLGNAKELRKATRSRKLPGGEEAHD
jgi:hypothetical protein